MAFEIPAFSPELIKGLPSFTPLTKRLPMIPGTIARARFPQPLELRVASWKYFGTLAAIAFVYFWAAKFGLKLAFVDKQATAVWPPTGIALAAVLLFGYRAWPGIAVGAFLINTVVGEPLTASGIALGNTLEALLGSWLLRQLVDWDNSLERLRNVFALVAAAFVSTVVSASIGVITLCLHGKPWTEFAPTWWVWWLGDAMGVLLVSPLLLTWAARLRIDWRGERLLEVAALFAALIFVEQVVFGFRFVTVTPNYYLEYLVFPFVIWAALRFGQRETSLAVVVVSAMAIWGAIHGRGPFAVGTPNERLIMLEMFMGVVAVTGLALGAVTAERKQSQEALHRAHEDLEARVRERTAELAEMNIDLERAIKAKDRFLANMSHELRTPLNAILGFTGTLLMELPGPLTPEQRKQLETVRSSGRHQLSLINDLLDLAKIDSGKVKLELELIDCGEVVNEIAETLRSLAEQKGLSFETNSPKHSIIRTDRRVLNQILINLVNNAIKFTSKGGVRIEVQQNGATRISVVDTGMGISQTDQPKVFDAFNRIESGDGDRQEGTGLGLHLSQKLAGLLGGVITLKSESGKGSAFTLSIQ